MEDIIFNSLNPEEGSFFAQGVKKSCFTEKGDKEIVTALRKAKANYTMFKNSLDSSFQDLRKTL